MKPFIKILIITILVSILIFSCTSPQKLLEKGNYYDAVLLSIQKLKKNSNNQKARETLIQAYPLALENLLDKLENNKLVQPQFINSYAAYTYEDLNKIYENIQRSPVAKQVIQNPEKFYAQLEKVKPLAAEEQYRAGMEQLAIGNRENAKQAYYYFQDADAFVNNYKDVSKKLEQSYNLALLHVVTDFKPVHSQMYSLSAVSFYNEIRNNLIQIGQKNFIKFYSINEASKANLKNPDQLLEINFEDFVVGETHTNEYIENMQKDSVKTGQVTLDNGSKKDVYGKVKAKVVIYQIEVISRGLVRLQITQNEAKHILLNQSFPGEYVWFNKWGSYNGDKRALNIEQLDICQNIEIAPPPPQQMFFGFTKPILSQLGRKLEYFYMDY